MRAAVGSDVILDRLLQLHPKIIDLTLERVWRLLESVGHPERALPPVIHIAGTNGKGSTLAMIRAGLEAQDDRVHTYTSPHLVRFHERIRLAGELIDETALAAVLEECERANGDAPITFFEITTVAALLSFARTPAEWLLLEVGLGGRLDATNVIDQPRLCAITPVSIDHQQYLGETLAEIAGEKAGILKPGVPCVVGPQEDAALRVIEERAATVGAPLLIHGQDWMVSTEHGRLVYQDDQGLLDLPMPALPGAHQVQNAGTALAALRQLGMAEGAADAALRDAEWPARLQRLRSGPLVDLIGPDDTLWLDGGHNAAAGAGLATSLRTLKPEDAELWLVCGMLDTKIAEDFLRPFLGLAEGVRTVEIPGAAASLSAEALAGTARSVGLTAVPAATAYDALKDILQTPGSRPKMILICGSLYLAGSILSQNA